MVKQIPKQLATIECIKSAPSLWDLTSQANHLVALSNPKKAPIKVNFSEILFLIKYIILKPIGKYSKTLKTTLIQLKIFQLFYQYFIINQTAIDITNINTKKIINFFLLI